MKSTLLALSAICLLLLFFSFSSRYATALEYVGTMLYSGYHYLDYGKYFQAIYCFNKVLQGDPTNSDALTGKASALIKLHMYDKAIPYLDKVLKMYPHNFNAIYGKAVVLSSIGKYNESLSYYEQIQKMAPTFPLTKKDLKIIHGEYSDAIGTTR